MVTTTESFIDDTTVHGIQYKYIVYLKCWLKNQNRYIFLIIFIGDYETDPPPPTTTEEYVDGPIDPDEPDSDEEVSEE